MALSSRCPDLKEFQDENSYQTGALLRTPLLSLNHFFAGKNLHHQLSEWGTGQGSFSKILPSLIAQSLGKEWLWLSDQEDGQSYAPCWRELGFDLNRLYFLKEKKILTSLRSLIVEDHFSFLIVDSRHFFSKADFHFFSQAVRNQKLTLFIFRPYFLSSKKGNPFCRVRINSSYEIHRQQFRLNFIKGAVGSRTSLSLNFNEVFGG